MADLRIDLAAEFKGKKAFKQADSAVVDLQKKVEKLGRSLGIALGTAAIVRYGKEAVKAFAADEAAAIRLANAVDNLGLAYSQPAITNFIRDLERTSAIADDVLRPSFQALLTTTKDLGASYKLLNDAIAISRGSGIDLATVAQDLANGYVGVTRGLRKYNTGLTQTELKQKSFTEILARLNSQFAGANQAYLESYSFKLEALTLAAENAKETIGEGLVNALARAGGGTEVQDAIETIDNIAKAINGVTTAVGYAIGGLVKLYKALDFITSFGGLFGANGKIVQKFDPKSLTSSTNSLAKTQLKTTTTLNKTLKTNTNELKKQAALKKAGTVFDMEQIQAIAALKGQLSAEDRKRVEAQLALMNENDALAQKLTREILMAQDATGGLYKYFLSIGDAKIKNPFAFLDEWLIEFQAKLNALKFPTAPTVSGAVAPTSGVIVGFKPQDMGVIPTAGPIQRPQIPATNASAYTGTIPTGNFTYGQGNPLNTNVYVTVQGSVTTEDDLVNKIASGLQQKSLSTGDSAYINRRTGGFAG